MRPRIAIPTPTSQDFAYNTQNWSAYADCVEASGGEAVQIELDLSLPLAAALAATCHGICLPGSPADVAPVRYGQDCDPSTAPADPHREQIDMLLLEEAFCVDLEKRKPLLGICFGLQSLNVFRGGTLVQDLAPMPVNHAAGPSVHVAHTADIASASLLSAIANPGGKPDGSLRLPINSSHHQAVGVPGAGLRVTARCPQDGVVEALELKDAAQSPFLLAVQWHPERACQTLISKGMFLALVQAAREPWGAQG